LLGDRAVFIERKEGDEVEGTGKQGMQREMRETRETRETGGCIDKCPVTNAQ
jgi:hypothetical protein